MTDPVRSLFIATLSHNDDGDPVLVLSRPLYRDEHCGHVPIDTLTVGNASTVGVGAELRLICDDCLMIRWYADREVGS